MGSDADLMIDVEQSEPVVCDICGTTVCLSFAVGKHMVVAHSGARIYRACFKCPRCGTEVWFRSRPVKREAS